MVNRLFLNAASRRSISVMRTGFSGLRSRCPPTVRGNASAGRFGTASQTRPVTLKMIRLQTDIRGS